MCAFVPAAWPAARAERCCGDEAARHERENEGLASESTHVLIPLSASFWGVGFVVQVVFFYYYYTMENVFLSKPAGSSETLKN